MNPNKRATLMTAMNEDETRTINHEGGMAFNPSEKLKLYLQTASWLVGEPKFYKDSDAETREITNLLMKVIDMDPVFVLKLASYLRNEMHLRTGPQLMLAYAAVYSNLKNGEIRSFCKDIMRRPDDITTCLSFVKNIIGSFGDHEEKGSIPSSLKKGIVDALEDFSEYQLLKYKNFRKTISIADVIKLCHPKPANEKRSILYKQIISGKTNVLDTWETIISTSGSTPEAWSRAIKKMPYMATLRNLRNMIKQNIDISEALERISNKDAVLKSKQLPFRFYSAYKTIDSDIETSLAKNKVLNTINDALQISIENVPHFNQTAAIFADNSGSMDCRLSRNSSITNKEVANLFMMFADKIFNETITGVFGADYATVSFSRHGMLEQMKNIPFVGHSTYAFLVFKELIRTKQIVDNVIIFSDMEIYSDEKNMFFYRNDNEFQEQYLKYRQINPNFKLFCIDLQGYGNITIPEKDPNVINIGGFSDKIFDIFKLFIEDYKNATKTIDEYKRK